VEGKREIGDGRVKIGRRKERTLSLSPFSAKSIRRSGGAGSDSVFGPFEEQKEEKGKQ